MLNAPTLTGQLNTNVQINNTAMPHHIYTDTHIYITFILLLILFFTLLTFSWAGQLTQTLVSDSSRLTQVVVDARLGNVIDQCGLAEVREDLTTLLLKNVCSENSTHSPFKMLKLSSSFY
jgi:hypothetical protein